MDFILSRHFSRLMILACFAALVCIFTACDNTDNAFADKKIFRYNEASGIMTLDPAFSRDQAHMWVCNQLFNGLVQSDDSLIIKPGIAKEWEISDDGLKYIFHLRNDVYFHQDSVFKGKKRRVEAMDFVYSLKRLASVKTASPGAWVLANVARVNDELAIYAVNDSTLSIILNKPFPPFLSILSMQYCSVLPFEAVEHYKENFRKHPVGTGPFYLQSQPIFWTLPQ